MNLPKRKQNRLSNFDYSSNGAYFITICTQDRRCILSNIVGASIARPPIIKLSDYGKIVDYSINSISNHYPNIIVDKYVIMPNHIHMILVINNEYGRAMLAPTISAVVQQMKGYVTKQIGKSIWQKLFYDHIIRNETDYNEIWQYIDTNPIKWERDKFFKK